MPNSLKNIAILNCRAPFATAHAKEALDVALIFGSFEQPTTLFFQGDGVYQLLDNQTPELINAKNFLKTFSAFKFYDLDTVYVCQQSLLERNIVDNLHLGNAHILPLQEFTELLHQHDVVFTF